MQPEEIRHLSPGDGEFPPQLCQLPQPPNQLFVIGAPLDELLAAPMIAIVGTRKATPYGRQVTRELASQLARAGVTIVSGLALGIDGLAHEAALEAGGRCLAVLPSPLTNIVPRRHTALAQRILHQGGALISEYPLDEPIQKFYFVARNRLVAGLSQAILIPEAGLKSGSLHTARFALEQGIDVLAVPGNITGPMSAGTNNLLKRGATPITSVQDVLHALNLPLPETLSRPPGSNAAEQTVLNLIDRGISDGTQLLEQSQLGVSSFNQTLIMLEVRGLVRGLGANHWGRC